MTLTEALHKKLAETSSEVTQKTWAERIAEVWVHEALGGNMVALRMILDRVEDPTTITVPAGTALPHPDDD